MSTAKAQDEANSRHQRGMELFNQGDYERAIPEFAAALALDSTRGLSWFWRGRCRFRTLKTDVELGYQDVEQAIKCDPKAKECPEWKLILLSRTDFAAAARGYDDLAALLDDANPDKKRLQAEACRCRSNLVGVPGINSLAEGKKAMQLDPSANNYKSRAVARANKHQWDKAVLDLTSCLQLAPRWLEVICYRGYCHIQNNKPQEAVKDFDLACSYASDEVKPIARAYQYHSSADFDYYAHRYNEALPHYTEALAQDPLNQWFWNARGNCCEQLGDLKHALRNANEAFWLDPALRTAGRRRCYGKMAVHVEAGEAKESLTQLKDGQYKRALHCLHDLIAKQPTPKLLCLIGTIRADMAEHVMAVDAFTKALALEPRNIDALSGRGRSRMKLSKHQEALTDFQDICKFSDDKAIVARYKLMVQEALKPPPASSKPTEPAENKTAQAAIGVANASSVAIGAESMKRRRATYAGVTGSGSAAKPAAAKPSPIPATASPPTAVAVAVADVPSTVTAAPAASSSPPTNPSAANPSPSTPSTNAAAAANASPSVVPLSSASAPAPSTSSTTVSANPPPNAPAESKTQPQQRAAPGPTLSLPSAAAPKPTGASANDPATKPAALQTSTAALVPPSTSSTPKSYAAFAAMPPSPAAKAQAARGSGSINRPQSASSSRPVLNSNGVNGNAKPTPTPVVVSTAPALAQSPSSSSAAPAPGSPGGPPTPPPTTLLPAVSSATAAVANPPIEETKKKRQSLFASFKSKLKKGAKD